MSINNFLLFIFFLASSSLSAERTAYLHYRTAIPVHLISDLKLDIAQSLPGLSLSTKGAQRMEADLTLRGGPPSHRLIFVLKHLDIGLQANDESLAFRTNEGESSLYLSQISKLIDRPIQLNLQENFRLSSDNEELRRIISELPVLTEISPSHLLIELFLHLFAPGGRHLHVGQVVSLELADREIPSLPKTVEYTITAIDDYNVYADVRGQMEKRKFQLSNPVVIGDTEEPVSAILTGQIEGKVKWNRDNAMLHELDLNYAYAARLQLADWEWLMNISLDLHNKTKL